MSRLKQMMIASLDMLYKEVKEGKVWSSVQIADYLLKTARPDYEGRASYVHVMAQEYYDSKTFLDSIKTLWSGNGKAKRVRVWIDEVEE